MDNVTPEQFYDHIEKVNAGMLAAGEARAVPMSHYVERETNTLFFIGAKGTDLAQASITPKEAIYIIAEGGKKIYARMHGRLAAVTDPAHLEEFWNVVASSWFEGGKDDPDVQLMRLDLSEAEVWTTDGAGTFLYETAKANLTGSTPDVGDYGTLRF